METTFCASSFRRSSFICNPMVRAMNLLKRARVFRKTEAGTSLLPMFQGLHEELFIFEGEKSVQFVYQYETVFSPGNAGDVLHACNEIIRRNLTSHCFFHNALSCIYQQGDLE